MKRQQPDGHAASQTEDSRSVSNRLRLLVFVLVLAGGMVYSLVQPLGMSPDEAAHAKYVKFLAAHWRLPDWRPDGGGEAGYEGQHPPLYYALGAVVYKLASPLPENWRWQLLRWYSLAIGAALIWAAWGLLFDCFRWRPAPTAVATAALGLTPLMLEYMSYINPDVMSVLWCCTALWMSIRIAHGAGQRRELAILTVSLGFGLLTKLTIIGVVPAVLTAVAWDWRHTPAIERERKRLDLLLALLGVIVIAGWWYFRNSLLFRTPFIHTTGRIGSGLDASQLIDPLHLVKLTLRNTYLTTWVERAWMPGGIIALVFYGLITLAIAAAVVTAILARVRSKRNSSETDPGPWLCAILVCSLLLFHQAQVWFVDYEFNAGGRYLLNGLVAIHAMLVAAFAQSRWRWLWYALWLGVLLFGNIASIHYMITNLNPSTVPGWHIFHLTIPYR